MKKNKITIRLSDYAYNQLLAVSNETKQTKSKIIDEILRKTLENRNIDKNQIIITIPKRKKFKKNFDINKFKDLFE